MTPVASWSPADFYLAVDRARAAWEATQPQLTITGWADALDELDSDGHRPALKLVERTWLASGTEPCCDPSSPPHRGDVAVPPVAAPLLSGGSVPSPPTTRGAASLSGSRGAPREGA